MSEVKVKLIRNHVKKCAAVKNAQSGLWPYPWAYFTGEVTYGSKVSPVSRFKTTRWIYTICNNTECKALLAVRESDLLTLVHKSLGEV